MNRSRFPSVSHPARSGFSLAEVVIALAIASLGFVTLLGILPQGLEMSRQAANLSAESRITQLLSGELQSTQWSELDWNGYGQARYFNDQGIELSSADVQKGDGLAFTLSYVASVQLPIQPLDLRLPRGPKGNSVPEIHLRRAKIVIAATSDPKFDFQKVPPAQRLRSYTVLVGNTGNDSDGVISK